MQVFTGQWSNLFSEHIVTADEWVSLLLVYFLPVKRSFTGLFEAFKIYFINVSVLTVAILLAFQEFCGYQKFRSVSQDFEYSVFALKWAVSINALRSEDS